MCGSCISNAESLVIGAVGATSGAVALARRAGDLLRGRASSGARAAAYAANADFLRSLGHDPALVLGPPPELRAETASRALASPAGALLTT